ncbi:SRPBCC family protein [Bdellovibrio sp. qaytius]|nr:SRPBCC family protein [Bdellovibrio sp. qaytius]
MSQPNHVESIPGLHRNENTDKTEMGGIMGDITHAVYPHDNVYGDYCPIQDYINCPPEKVFEYMANPHSLAEWTYSMRNFEKLSEDGLFVGRDRIGDNTDIYFKVKSNKEALTVDYHCAWDQGDDLWMIYLNRIVPAEVVLNKPGSVVFWQNCRHPHYLKNPYPEKSPKDRPWVGQFWDFFYAGHTVELQNLKKILEYRHSNNLPMGPL